MSTLAVNADGTLPYTRDATGHPVIKQPIIDSIVNESSALTIYQTAVVLTNAQIKALPTTAITLVAAPGALKFLAPVAAWFYVDWHADYTNLGDAVRIGVGYAGTLTSVLAQFAATQVGDLLADGASHVGYMPIENSLPNPADEFLTLGRGQVIDEPGAINAAMDLYCSNTGSHTGNFTGGHASNTISVTVWYGIVDLS